jgi:hypothetical protein
MSKKLTLHDLELRIAALETAIASLTVTSTPRHRETPSGKFAHLGGIERRPGTSFEKREKPIDFSHIGGKKVGQLADGANQ